MGRKSLSRQRKAITPRTKVWLGDLLLSLQQEQLDDLTMDDLARLAGKSKSTIYEYFETKEDVLVAVCQLRVDELSTSIFGLEKEAFTTVELYARLIEIFAKGTTGISISFLQSIKQSYPKSWEMIDGFMNGFVDLLKEHYKVGIEEGIYTPVSVDLLGSIDKLFVEQVVTNRTLFTDEMYTVSNLVTDYLSLRLNGLLLRT